MSRQEIAGQDAGPCCSRFPKTFGQYRTRNGRSIGTWMRPPVDPLESCGEWKPKDEAGGQR